MSTDPMNQFSVAAGQPQSAKIASDSDKLEAHWAQEVQAVVDRFANDPHGLSDALADLKREYIAARYGKHLPTQGDGAASE